MKKSVYQNASAVTLLSVLKRALGFLYRIFLSRLLGAEGIGLYQTAQSFFYVFATLGAGGIPVSVSRLICKNKAAGTEFRQKNIVSAAITLGLIVTLPVCIGILLFGDSLTGYFGDGRVVKPMKILFIGLAFSSMYHTLRGFFWGNKQLLLPNVLELVEECINVALGIFLLTTSSSLEDGVFKACLAVAVTDVSCFLIAFLCYTIKGGKLSSPTRELKPLFSSAAPITSVRVVSSIVNSAVAVILPAMLMKAGETQASAIGLFGVVSGMVLPILFTPMTVIGSLGFVLAPELSENFYKKNFKTLALNIERGLLGGLVIACVLIPFFSVLGRNIGALTYSNALAGELIANSAILLLPMSLNMLSTTSLNSMGFEKQTFLFSFIGEVVMLLCVFFLPKFMGVYAYVVAIGLNFLFAGGLSLIFLFRRMSPSGSFWKSAILFIAPILPITLIGRLFFTVLEPYLSAFIVTLISALFLIVLFVIYFVFVAIFTKKGFREVFLRKK